MAVKNTFVSIVVPTYDRPALLRKCLASLNFEGFSEYYEVIVVDNHSSGGARPVADELFGGRKNRRYITEKRQGLSHTKNKGWRAARGNYVAFLDDDAVAEKDWLKEVISFIKRRPKVAVFGGPYSGYVLSEKPNWFPPEYGSFSLGRKERTIKPPKESLSGSNTIYKKEILRKFSGFREELGMKGKDTSYGEETRLIYDMAKDGNKIYYSPKIKIKHLISKRKLNLGWLLKDSFIRGTLWSTIQEREIPLKSRLKRTWRSLSNLKYLFDSNKGPFKRRIYYASRPILSNLGGLNYHLKNNFFSKIYV